MEEAAAQAPTVSSWRMEKWHLRRRTCCEVPTRRNSARHVSPESEFAFCVLQFCFRMPRTIGTETYGKEGSSTCTVILGTVRKREIEAELRGRYSVRR
jgi:hypothetical protein